MLKYTCTMQYPKFGIFLVSLCALIVLYLGYLDEKNLKENCLGWDSKQEYDLLQDDAGHINIAIGTNFEATGKSEQVDENRSNSAGFTQYEENSTNKFITKRLPDAIIIGEIRGQTCLNIV